MSAGLIAWAAHRSCLAPPIKRLITCAFCKTKSKILQNQFSNSNFGRLLDFAIGGGRGFGG